MSDKDKPEKIELKALEPKLDETVITDSPIANPTDQKTWNKIQEVHQLKEGDSATHIALPPGDLQKLQSEGKAEKFEIIGLEPAKPVKQPEALLDTLVVDGKLPEEFLNQVKQGLRQIPENERQLLKKFGVKVVATELVEGHGGSQAIYDPNIKTIFIGMKGSGVFQGEKDVSGNVSLETFASIIPLNKDVAGSLKHETGHAIYHALNLEQWKEFKIQSQQEKQVLDADNKEHLSHLLSEDTELFAESYASIRGRHTDRVTRLNNAFPKTIGLVSDLLKNQPGSNQK